MTAAFNKAFRESRRLNLWVSIGLALYTAFVLSIYPTIFEQQEEFNELLQNYPPELLSMMGVSSGQNTNIADPGFFLQVYVGTWAVLILGVLVTMQAFNAVTNAERNGTLDVMLSYPVTRRDYLLARMANTAVTILISLTVITVLVLGATAMLPEFEVDPLKLILAMYSGFFLLMTQAGLSYLLASFVPSSRRWAGAVALTIFIGSYLIFGFASNSLAVESIRGLLMFNYYNAGEIINEGVNLADWLVLGGAGLLLVAIAYWRIDHKELAV